MKLDKLNERLARWESRVGGWALILFGSVMTLAVIACVIGAFVEYGPIAAIPVGACAYLTLRGWMKEKATKR